MQDKQRILDKIRKMLEMAKDERGNNANEAAVAAAMAEKLMRKYNLDHADVLIEELGEDSIIAYQSDVHYASSRRMPTWVNAIVVSVAQYHDCEARYDHDWIDGAKGRRRIVTFLGEKSDVIVASWVFEYLLEEIRRLTNAWSKETGLGGKSKDSFRKGCAFEVNNTLCRMIREKEAELAGHSTGTALVLRKRDLVAQKFDVSYSDGRRSRMGDARAAAEGRAAGRNVSIRKGVESHAENRAQLGK